MKTNAKRNYYGKAKARGIRITAQGYEALIRYHDFRCQNCKPKAHCIPRQKLDENLEQARTLETRQLALA